MGIQGLTRLINDCAPGAHLSKEIKAYIGRKVAIDASMSIYQFLIAVRGQDGKNLSNDAGDNTSHLAGLFYRTVRMVENGIKPVYVFDGKPPTMKSGELAKRSERRAEAQKELTAAEETGDLDSITKFTKRLVKVTPQHNNECKSLLKYMGIPYVEAPCEAEAQCAALCKAGKVWAAASEDMDTLCFGAPVLLRRLTFSEAKKLPILEFHLDKVLDGLELDLKQLIDLGIILGCDYCGTIRNVGPKTGITLLKKHKDLETVIQNLSERQTLPPESDFNYVGARELFINPNVKDPAEIDLVWSPPDVNGTLKFMCDENGFNRDRIMKGLEKLEKGLKTSKQGRLDSFFSSSPKPSPSPNNSKSTAGTKRKSTSTTAKKSSGSRFKSS
ncbi:hypothetical protein BB561_004029 [Smittium simulii]|uniref:Flap endonuclease 1 n=1 Tax=Smittium simulii TaxID=133385 RepID=A0A2T9YIF5_9FUNG|nr:hypothetical protein BB561_004029 [Smittium simulii]